ncbi:putative Flap endonuclease 1-A [Cocos nucifera]|uniref:Putative Flap endonuclease 1-A n=1 Tax=Cocos nucifera TaxID=13894 RepID=A0A8K0IS82_COCNU|nr:putative Flap endonuclease 1-A [Cocos nucifera]
MRGTKHAEPSTHRQRAEPSLTSYAGKAGIVVGRTGMETLTNEAGEVTRYVFDGQPPDLKKQELAKRFSRREDATKDLSAAIEDGDKESIEKFSKRTVKVYAVASEDMDSLTFGAPRFLRHLMDPSSKKVLVMEYEVSKVLEELELTMDQFIDLCILSGCDYCDSIKG